MIANLVETILRACDLLEAFHSDGELLRLRDLVARAGTSKAGPARWLD